MDGSIVGVVVVVVLVVPVDLGIVDCHTTGHPRRNSSCCSPRGFGYHEIIVGWDFSREPWMMGVWGMEWVTW